MTVHYSDDTITLHHGDSLDVLRTLPDQSVDCCVTSPPYFGLRDYGVAGQIGAEATPGEFVEKLRELFAEVRRVLADDGTCWLNLGDSYSSNASNNGGYSLSSTLHGKPVSGAEKGARANLTGERRALAPGVGPKNLLGVPWRVAFALQDDGWILRNAIIWNKPNAMPESVTDRLSTRYEHLFLLAKSKRYWFDLDPIRESTADRSDLMTWAERKEAGGRFSTSNNRGVNTGDSKGLGTFAPNSAGKNPGDVWNITTAPFGGAHFAAYPPELVRRCIISGCKPGGTVLDPFNGTGTTGMVALRHGRKYIGIDLNAEYLDLSLRTRLHTGTLDFGDAS